MSSTPKTARRAHKSEYKELDLTTATMSNDYVNPYEQHDRPFQPAARVATAGNTQVATGPNAPGDLRPEDFANPHAEPPEYTDLNNPLTMTEHQETQDGTGRSLPTYLTYIPKPT